MTVLRSLLAIAAGFAALALAGCVTVEVSATNPVPNLTTVAVVPFFNLSAERTVDGRRFAIAYYTELQKTPGFQVIPVGVVEQAIQENQLSMESQTDVLRLAEILGVDAVAVGAVTEYAPYYPPKLGLQVQWYSPRKWTFYPGPPSPGGPPPMARTVAADLQVCRSLAEFTASERSASNGARDIVRAQGPDDDLPVLEAPAYRQAETTVEPEFFPKRVAQEPEPAPPPRWPGSAPQPAIQPLMTYTRFFDGADPRLTSRLCRYVAWRSDRRSGDWEAHLHRSDDFIQFCSHLMVLEMLSQNGATVQTEYLPFWKS